MRKFIKIKEIMRKLDISMSTFHKLKKDSTFPKPVKIGRKLVRYDEIEITDWINSK